jgi:zinc transporter 9
MIEADGYNDSVALKNTAGVFPVVTAIGGNAVVMIAKFIAAFISGSSVMFSEAIHSTADTANQILVLVGLQRSLKKADDSFEYGYGNERFFWALLSACGIFFVGAGVTGYKGIVSLLHPEIIEFNWIVAGVLVFAFVVESYTFIVAAQHLRQMMPRSTWRERIAEAEPTTLAVFLEDAIAVLGVGVAAAALFLSYFTGNPRWDAVGSIIISILLGVVAIVLILKNRAFLIGLAMPEDVQEQVVSRLLSDPAIEKIIDFKSTTLGWGVYRIKFEVEFNSSSLLREAYRGKKMREEYDAVRDDFDAFVKFSGDFADRMPRLIGNKIDEIEEKLMREFPSIKHIDIEVN